MSKNKVLLLNYAFYPDVIAVAQQLTDLGVDLVKAGCEVTAVVSRRAYDDRSQVYPLKEDYQGVHVQRIRSTFFGKKSFIARIVDTLSFNIYLFLKLVFGPRYDVIVCLTLPPLISIIGEWFCRIRGGKFVYWVMDLNPDEAIALGVLKKEALLTRFLEILSRSTFRSSDLIIALDEYMAKRIQEKGIEPEKIKVIPPWAHNDQIKPVPHAENPFRQQHGLENKFVVMYSGNHSVCHPLNTLLEAALKLQKDPDFIFMFVGGGVGVKKVAAFKATHHLSNIIQLPYQPLEQLSYSLSAADLHVVVMGNEYVGIVHPCKIYGVLCTERPVLFIGPEESSIGNLVHDEQIGYQVAHGEVQKCVATLLQAKVLSTSQKQSIRDKSQQLLRLKYSHQVLAAQLVKLVCRCAE
ncbi:glycosyltransferase family 4 protein [Deltaproteobacteria bacterium TL4]